MSVTLKIKNKNIEPLLPNISGWQLYGHVNLLSDELRLLL